MRKHQQVHSASDFPKSQKLGWGGAIRADIMRRLILIESGRAWTLI